MAWELYKEIKYTADGVPPGTLSGFPKLVSVSGDADIASECSAGGGIKFTTPDGLTDLSFGLYPSVDLSSGDVLARVKLDLSNTASVGDVMCRLYYSATETTTEDKAGTVDNNYAVFCPLEDDPSGAAPQIFDWVAESFIGTTQGGMTAGDSVAGAVGQGLNFDGVNDYIQLGNYGLASTGNVTLEALVAHTTNPSSHLTLIGEGYSESSQPVFLLGVRRDTLRAIVSGFTSGSNIVTGSGLVAVNDGNLHSAVAVLRSSDKTLSVYIDGQFDGSVDTTSSNSHEDALFDRLSIGAFWRDTVDSFVPGLLDEVRVSSVARSADWLAYAHIDDLDNISTFTLGEEQGGGGGPTFNPAWAVGSNIVIMGT